MNHDPRTTEIKINPATYDSLAQLVDHHGLAHILYLLSLIRLQHVMNQNPNDPYWADHFATQLATLSLQAQNLTTPTPQPRLHSE